ncbi:prenyltransferase [Sulfurivirga sp.]|uniref:prenyltransferase n=1 Tax=Sulfurivirga sp. TaxID=2614236 RepID=UPI0026002B88|nr:prenyltransferase [Sulfurivirga sp.]
MTHTLKTVWRAMRPPFLLLTVSVVTLGAALAVFETGVFHGLHFFLSLLGGLGLHASVNLFNEYEDFRSGLDSLTERTPFSGGSGALQADPDAAEAVQAAGWFLLGLAFVIGLWFWWTVGGGVVWIGLAGVVLVLGYTGRITRHPWLCLIAPGLAFGPLMVLGTYYVMTGQFSARALVVSLVPFFLVNNLLLLNQIPDIEADRQVGRRTFPMVMGVPLTLQVFNLFLLCAYGVLVMLVAAAWLPPVALLGLVTAIFALPMLLNLMRFRAGRRQALLPALGLNVAINLLTPLLVAAALFWLTRA